MQADYQGLKAYFLEFYKKKNYLSESGWYSNYTNFAQRLRNEYTKNQTISDELLDEIWCRQNNSIANITQLAVIPRNSFELIKNELRQITLQIIQSSDADADTYSDVSKKMLLLKAENKLSKNYQAVKDRFYALMYPDKFTTIVARKMFSKVYHFLNSKFSLNLSEQNGWYKSNVTLKFVLEEVLSDELDSFMINVILWDIYTTLSNDTNMDDDEELDFESTHPLNQILYGPPGTGKTYHTIIKALEIIGEETEGKDRAELKQIFDEKVQSGQIVFTTFHQSMCYEDFIEGIKPVLVENEAAAIGYQIENGIFKVLADKANVGNIDKTSSIDDAIEQFKQLCSEQKIELKTSTNKSFYVEYHGNTTFRIYPENTIHEDLGNGYPASIADVIEYIKTEDLKNSYNSSYVRAIGNYLKSKYQLNLISKTGTNKQNFVLIIDEINRGNVAQIFGELITLIEEDKRLGNPEALTVTLPYSKKPFGVPNNLYIIGTMNTADRSVEALDSALRRRFSFSEMLPEAAYLVNQQGERLTIDGIVLADLLHTINQRLELLLDRDHQIGHSYLLNVTNTEQLCQAFANKIIPLLQEYFFNDYAKIGLVLGKGFIKQIQANIAFAPFADNDYSDQEKSRYQLIPINKNNIIAALNLMNIQSMKETTI